MGGGKALRFLRSEPTLRTRCARRRSGSRLFKDRGGKYWGSGVPYSFIPPAAGKAGGTGPALVDSAAGWPGLAGAICSHFLAQGQILGFINATVYFRAISLVRTL